MPTYKFKDTNTKKEWTEFMSISEADKFLAENPHVEQLVHGCPSIGYTMITKKPDDGFRDVLREIKKKHRKSTVNTW